MTEHGLNIGLNLRLNKQEREGNRQLDEMDVARDIRVDELGGLGADDLDEQMIQMGSDPLYRVEGFIYVVFDGPPGPESGRFIEVENQNRQSIRVGEWLERDDGYWALQIPRALMPFDF